MTVGYFLTQILQSENHTIFGQKGSGESGYLGAPAAISSAINDALSPLNISFLSLPIRMGLVSDAIAKRDVR